MSDARQAILRSDNRMGAGYLPVFTPVSQLVRLIDVKVKTFGKGQSP